ncbi:MAG: ATP-dependent DNA helicase [Bacillota bacterium]
MREAHEAVLAVFGPDGLLAGAIPGFEYRPPQAEMAATVWQAFARGKTAIIEAGTGTGKSLAYLYPGLVHARLAGRPLIVSTNTINLQEQLLEKDLPTLAGLVSPPPRAVLLLGRGNYLCRRRLNLPSVWGGMLDGRLHAAILRAAEEGRGERPRLGFSVPEEAWSRIASDGQTCLRQHCPWHETCFWQAARRAAAAAEIILVNHHLLLSDAVLRRSLGWDTDRAVLPRYDRVVFDEAHHLEEIATEHLARRIDGPTLHRLLDLLHRSGGHEPTGVLAYCLLGVATGGPVPEKTRLAEARSLAAEALQVVERLRAKAGPFFALLASFAREGGQDGSRWQRRYRGHLGRQIKGFGELAEDLLVLAGELADLLSRLLSRWEADPEAPTTEEGLVLKAALGGLLDFRDDLPAVLAGEDEDHVYWVETAPRGEEKETTAVMAPLEVGPLLCETLFAHLHSAVFASATLTADGGFGFFRERLGLDLVHPACRLELVLPSPFDYRRQVLLAVPRDLPEPDDAAFPEAASSFLRELLVTVGGRTLILFTSYTTMEKVSCLLRASLPPGLFLRQQGERPRGDLLAELREGEGIVLCGTDSFWEGVDVAGEALSCVVIARLPFSVPREPVVEARMEHLEREGENGFYRYLLPQAVLKLKQGFGRLVRRGGDTGVVVILDRRFLDRAYGRYFYEALPRCTECFAASPAVLAAVRDWFAGRRTAAG